ncbi:MAG: hypothetical protein QHH12_01475 [Candidatus Bathyarchaeota archaeon]|jgi:hypothetical protein|nr:hypothetical protein [Candidatus Bathyarchaeota archaeon A05DMB-3]MDH7606426.1 hypothetical protein [Candidatus Bathyarchaeota archaeon]
MRCKVCSRDAVENDYCELHARAYQSIMKKYEVWKRALEISWKEYLSEIAKNPFTGEWAKEVAEHLLKGGEEESGA